MLDRKLQLKSAQTVAVVGSPISLDLEARPAELGHADAVVVFALSRTELRTRFDVLESFAVAGKLTWVAYPKAGQLGTDLNRDSLRALCNERGLDPVRQIAITDTWSALRLKSLPKIRHA